MISPAARQAALAMALAPSGAQETASLLERRRDDVATGPASGPGNQRRRRNSTAKGPARRASVAASNAQVILEVDNVGLRLRDFDLPIFSRREKASMSECQRDSLQSILRDPGTHSHPLLAALRAIAMRKARAQAAAAQAEESPPTDQVTVVASERLHVDALPEHGERRAVEPPPLPPPHSQWTSTEPRSLLLELPATASVAGGPASAFPPRAVIGGRRRRSDSDAIHMLLMPSRPREPRDDSKQLPAHSAVQRRRAARLSAVTPALTPPQRGRQHGELFAGVGPAGRLDAVSISDDAPPGTLPHAVERSAPPFDVGAAGVWPMRSRVAPISWASDGASVRAQSTSSAIVDADGLGSRRHFIDV